MTRRELLARAAGAGAFGAALRAPAAAAAASRPIPSDGELIAGLIASEQLMIAVYEHALASDEPRAQTQVLAGAILIHEHLHVQALTGVLAGLGVRPPAAPSSTKALERALVPHHVIVDFSHKRTADRWLRLLSDVEDVLERNYHLAISLLRRPDLLRLCAEIHASEAQHSAVLGEQLYPRRIGKALPNAFINGD